MITSRLLAAALVAAAILATPAIARTSAVTSHLAANADAGLAPDHAVHGSRSMRTPRVGAHVAPVPAGGTCDVGDNERVC